MAPGKKPAAKKKPAVPKNKATPLQKKHFFSKINANPNAKYIYANKKWQFANVGFLHALLLSNTRNGNVFYINKTGRKPYTKNYVYGPGPNNYVPLDLIQEQARGYQYRIPRPSGATVAGYMSRMAKKPGQNKKIAEQKARVNKIISNIKAGGILYKKARLPNLVQVVMKSNSSPYFLNNNGKYKNALGRVPTRKMLLNTIEDLKSSNLFKYL
jgi:hypothetical protein